MATKIKVKKMTDLTQVMAEDSLTDTGVTLSDMILVAHGTNHNDDEQVVYHSNSMTMKELLSYMRTQLADDFMSKEDGNNLSDEVEKRLREAEENMSKSDTADTFFSKIYADDSGKCPIGSTWQVDAGVSSLYTSEYVFNCDSKAYCHFVSQLTASANVKDADAKAVLQAYTENGWKTVCLEPMQKPDFAFDIDLHGYFYGGSKLRAGIVIGPSTGGNTISKNVDKKYSCLYISRTSDKTPFPISSFSWWTSNQLKLSSSIDDQPQAISSDGFVSFSGKYYSGSSPLNIKYFGGKPKGSSVNVISAPYVMNTVYANAMRNVNGALTQQKLGNAENNNMFLKNAAQTDDFSGKYYYISASETEPVSVNMITDYKFDDSKNRYSVVGGNVNPTQVKYTEFGEISSVVGEDKAEEVPCLTDLIDQYDNNTAEDYHGFHSFHYSGGIPMYSAASKVFVAASLPYIGTDQRNTAYMSINAAAGSEGCYMRERQQLKSGGARDTYSFMPYAIEGQTSKTIIRDDSAGRAEEWTETGLSIDILNKNVSKIGIGRNPYENGSIAQGSKNDTYANAQKFVTNDISNGWTLTSVQFEDTPDGSNLGLANFAFSACPRLSSVEFKKNMSMGGLYTFAAPEKMIKYATFSASEVKVNNGLAGNQSSLSAVRFCDLTAGGTHVEDGVMYGTFANCVNLISANLSCTDATALSGYVFYNCGRLKEIALPSACAMIGEYVFGGCSSLTGVSIDSNLTSYVGKSAFTKASSQLTAKNTYAAKWTDGYQYSLSRNGGAGEYYIAITLSGPSADYYGTDEVASTDKIFEEISAATNILRVMGLGCTTASAYKANTGVWTTGAGRRYYIKSSDGALIMTTKTSGKALVYNTIGTADKIGVESVKKLMAIDDSTSSADHCNPKC